ncbi:MAG: 6-carboxyhexanoate--CoA ligase [Puniceicoccales bacterium]|jgi:6-carboxyhexanoate--CoA ligase|nr:6-carboxyhexanoate--CoA ligase [Puniceicoccales bacterium]
MANWFSVRMRATDGDMHEDGGTHISGCERLIMEELVPFVLTKMWMRAKSHERGNASMINIRIDTVDSASIRRIPPLRIESAVYATVDEARRASCALLQKNGISETAARKAIESISSLSRSMRGAIVMDAFTGERLDWFGERGVRVSHMDCEDEKEFTKFLFAATLNFFGEMDAPRAITKFHEAIILASKAASAPGYVSELCWSDDINYPTGYVASGEVYCRITPMKELGNPVGGRVLFVRTGTPLAKTVDYWQERPVLVGHEFHRTM